MQKKSGAGAVGVFNTFLIKLSCGLCAEREEEEEEAAGCEAACAPSCTHARMHARTSPASSKKRLRKTITRGMRDETVFRRQRESVRAPRQLTSISCLNETPLRKSNTAAALKAGKKKRKRPDSVGYIAGFRAACAENL